jgi:hypothetical protein
VISLLLALYPARWRRRYGEEFRAVLESRPIGPYDVADVLLGAVDARLTPFRLPGMGRVGGHLVLLKLGGFGAVVGGTAWFAGIAGASGLGGGDTRLWVAVMLLGTLGLLLALVGLSAFQAHRDPALAWLALAIPGIGAVIAAIGIGGMLFLPEDGTLGGTVSPWNLWIVGMFTNFVGSIFFAIATYQAQVLSSRAARALGFSAAVALVVALMSMGTGDQTNLLAVLVPAAIGAFAASWVWLGLSALRRGPIRAIAPA